MLFLYYAALLYFALLSSAETSRPVVADSASYEYEIKIQPKEGTIYGISHSSIVSFTYNFSSYSKLTVFYRTQRGRLESGASKRSTSGPSQETQGLPSLQLYHFYSRFPNLSVDTASGRRFWSQTMRFFRREKKKILHQV